MCLCITPLASQTTVSSGVGAGTEAQYAGDRLRCGTRNVLDTKLVKQPSYLRSQTGHMSHTLSLMGAAQPHTLG